jgi:aryl-alcohol dehydrogenase-like predicted oxidoreductase
MVVETSPGRRLPRRRFGRTGHDSSQVIFGAAALSEMRQERADDVLLLLDEFGVNHLDTAASYGDAELRLAPWLATRRADFFLATKTGERTASAAREELERSLARLGVEQVDLIQLHNLVESDEWEVAHAPGGAVEAMVQAREEGLTRFIGVTGHGLRIPGMHVRSLERFDFDSVLFPLNFSLLEIDDYRRDVEALRALCADRDVAVQTIKAVARRRWAEDGPHHSWYEPLTEADALTRAVGWVLSDPGVFLNSSSDATLLRSILEAAVEPVHPTDEEMRADVERESILPLFDGSVLERI